MYTEQFVRLLMGYVGKTPYAVLSLGFLLVVPVVLLVIFVLVLVNASGRARQGLFVGVGAAAWASICWLAVPYLGAYPNLPALTVKVLVFKWGPVETLAEELAVHLANFVIWPLLGWSIVRVQQAVKKHRLQHAQVSAPPPPVSA